LDSYRNEIQGDVAMGESNKSKRAETREFWGAAIRLWNESRLSVREFCRREGLSEHAFYSWRRTLTLNNPSSVAEADAVTAGSRKQGRRKEVVASADKSSPAVEFLPVRIVGKEVSRVRAASAGAAGTERIEVVGASPWRVRISAGFDPRTLEAVLTVLERRPC
jgi:transposase-like protein